MHFLLLHGGGHGGWCWDEVLGFLRTWGMSASAPDLPGSGADASPRLSVDLDDYIAAAIAHVDRIDRNEGPIVIVAHSIAGMVAPGVAAARPQRIGRVIFLAALVTRTGERGIDSIPEDRRSSYFTMAEASGENSLLPDFDSAWARFFPSVSHIQARELYARLTPQPLGPYLQPSPCGADVLENLSIGHSYVLLEQDLTFPPPLARDFAARADCVPIEMPGDHCWMLTEPMMCAREIARIAETGEAQVD